MQPVEFCAVASELREALKAAGDVARRAPLSRLVLTRVVIERGEADTGAEEGYVTVTAADNYRVHARRVRVLPDVPASPGPWRLLLREDGLRLADAVLGLYGPVAAVFRAASGTAVVSKGRQSATLDLDDSTFPNYGHLLAEPGPALLTVDGSRLLASVRSIVGRKARLGPLVTLAAAPRPGETGDPVILTLSTGGARDVLMAYIEKDKQAGRRLAWPWGDEP